MVRLLATLPLLIVACGLFAPRPIVLSLCDLSRDFAAYRNELISVRGVYYYGLRETCPQKCANGPWPSFVDLTRRPLSGSDQASSRVATDDTSWAALAKALKDVEGEAKAGKRFEIWVTVVGQLKTRARHPPLGPCDAIGSGHTGYGHLGAFPAEVVVHQFSDITVKQNADSLYDYGNVPNGPA